MDKNTIGQKNCLLTGATGGLGKELAFQLTQNNCNVFLTSKNEKKLSALKDELEKTTKNNVKIRYNSADFTDIVEIYDVIKKIRNEFDSIDILINCAGIFPINSLEHSSESDFDKCFNVNVKAPFLLSKEFSKDMIKKKWGRIVNIGSSSSYGGFKETSIYCASKHAILGISRSIHSELKEHNIRTYCISPGSMKTKMAEVLTKQDFNTFINPKEVAKFIVFTISFDNEMISDEIRLNRMKYQ